MLQGPIPLRELDLRLASCLNKFMKTTVWLVFILLSSTVLRALNGDNQKPFDLTTLLGETFQHCRIIKATPEGITVLHDGGVSKIPFENLNDDWKKLFNYSPDKSSAFQKEEAARRTLAEEKQRQAQKEYEQLQTKQLSAVATAENRRLQKLEEAIAKQQVEAAAAAAMAVVSQPGLMIPLPGDPTPYFNTGVMTSRTSTVGSAHPTVQSTMEVHVPATTPITQIYTPGGASGQRYIINQGAVFTPGDGTIYYVNPGYMNPGYITPGYTNQPIFICPPTTIRPSIPVRPAPVIRNSSTNIRVGSGVIHVGP